MNDMRIDSPFPGMRRVGLAAACAAAVLLAACANYRGISSSAHLDAPGEFASSTSLPGQGGKWPSQNWAEDIGGASLQDLVNEALAGNPNLQAAQARVNAARAMLDAAGAARKPIVGASASDTYERFTEYGLIPPPFGGQYYSDVELGLNFSYDFDFWGKHDAELRQAVSDEKAVEAEQYNARLMIATAVARTWIQLARQYEQLDIVQRQQAVRAQVDKLTQLRLNAGLDTQAEKQTTIQQTAALKNEETQWQEAIALSRNQLGALLGKGPDRGLSIPAPVLPAASASDLPDNLTLDLIGRRPDIVAARWRVEAAQGGIADAKAQFYPNVNITAFIGQSALAWSDILKPGARTLGVGPAITMPVFEGGRLRAQLKGRTAAYDGAIATYNQALNDALHDVADQVQSAHYAKVQSDNQHVATAAAEANLKLARQREQVGTINMLQVLGTESAWLAQRKLQLDIDARRADLRVSLIKALGGGFDANAASLAAPANSSTNTNNGKSAS
ncbi:MAG TPA: efflux transporter outer membrane subunit [Burkholderiaceae bacterium]